MSSDELKVPSQRQNTTDSPHRDRLIEATSTTERDRLIDPSEGDGPNAVSRPSRDPKDPKDPTASTGLTERDELADRGRLAPGVPEATQGAAHVPTDPIKPHRTTIEPTSHQDQETR
ncbi:hypothetical protein GCM10022224_071650 [Nonomuraea antimicrobica]|uniref:Uncharacterized protein n=1 Tax=Nonomuraea antimicrobica TaxID=561173 RepID=A0ABP7CSH4_9ACTN